MISKERKCSLKHSATICSPKEIGKTLSSYSTLASLRVYYLIVVRVHS